MMSLGLPCKTRIFGVNGYGKHRAWKHARGTFFSHVGSSCRYFRTMCLAWHFHRCDRVEEEICGSCEDVEQASPQNEGAS